MAPGPKAPTIPPVADARQLVATSIVRLPAEPPEQPAPP